MISKYNYTNEDLSISRIVQRINELKTNDGMSKLKVADVCKWLISMDLLIECLNNGKKNKVPT